MEVTSKIDEKCYPNLAYEICTQVNLIPLNTNLSFYSFIDKATSNM